MTLSLSSTWQNQGTCVCSAGVHPVFNTIAVRLTVWLRAQTCVFLGFPALSLYRLQYIVHGFNRFIRSIWMSLPPEFYLDFLFLRLGIQKIYLRACIAEWTENGLTILVPLFNSGFWLVSRLRFVFWNGSSDSHAAYENPSFILMRLFRSDGLQRDFYTTR